MSDNTPELTPKQLSVIAELPGRTTEIADALDISTSAVRNRIDAINAKYPQGNYHPIYTAEDGTRTWDDDEPLPSSSESEASDSDVELQFDASAPEQSTEPETFEPDPGTIPDGFPADLKAGMTFEDIREQWSMTKSVAKRVMRDMRENGYTIDHKVVDEQGTRLFYRPEEHDKQFQVGDGDGRYVFGLISDTHLGSRAEHLDELHDFYDQLVERGISLVFHAGDIGDGWRVHKGQINEVKGEAAGWDRLEDYIVENYPSRDGIDTLFISGNHDHKLHRRTGVRFCKLVDRRRDDLHWCGDSQATFYFDDDVTLELIHPSGGKPYTVGYRLQTLFRERPIHERPTIAAVGHLHGSMYAETEGVKGLYTGAWKGLTTYGKRKGHASSIGGWIIDMTIRDGVVQQFTPQWVGYESNDTANNYSLEDIGKMVSGSD